MLPITGSSFALPIAAIPTAAEELPALQNVRLSADGVLTFDPFVNPQGGTVIYNYDINKLGAPVSGGDKPN